MSIQNPRRHGIRRFLESFQDRDKTYWLKLMLLSQNNNYSMLLLILMI